MMRDGKRVAAPVGFSIEVKDTVKTGADGSVGITFHDNSLLSAGPNSELVIEKFVFDSTTHVGQFDTQLKKGTLAVVSGKIVKQSPERAAARLKQFEFFARLRQMHRHGRVSPCGNRFIRPSGVPFP